MPPPPKCFTCAKENDRWLEYDELVNEGGYGEEVALDMLDITRICCRRMYMKHVELLPKQSVWNRMSEAKLDIKTVDPYLIIPPAQIAIPPCPGSHGPLCWAGPLARVPAQSDSASGSGSGTGTGSDSGSVAASAITSASVGSGAARVGAGAGGVAAKTSARPRAVVKPKPATSAATAVPMETGDD